MSARDINMIPCLTPWRRLSGSATRPAHYDTIIRTDSQLITKHAVLGADGKPLLYAKNLNDFDAIFFFGVREIVLTPEQKADLLSFVHDDGKGIHCRACRRHRILLLA